MIKFLLVVAATAASTIALAAPASADARCTTPTVAGFDTVQVCIDLGLED